MFAYKVQVCWSGAHVIHLSHYMTLNMFLTNIYSSVCLNYHTKKGQWKPCPDEEENEREQYNLPWVENTLGPRSFLGPGKIPVMVFVIFGSNDFVPVTIDLVPVLGPVQTVRSRSLLISHQPSYMHYFSESKYSSNCFFKMHFTFKI